MTESASHPPEKAGPSLRVAVTGSTGMIGTEVVRRLRFGGHRVVRLVRREPEPGSGDVRWDPDGGRIDAAALEGTDAVIHLAGENVGERWTEERKARIRRSRVDGTRLLAEALAGLRQRPRVLVSASAVGIYGERGDEVLEEGSAPGTEGFLTGVVRGWEEATAPAREAGVRVALLRLGVVLSAEGGALAKMLPPFRMGAGGRMGDGRQWMSWISLEDAVEAVLFALENEGVSGPVNVVAPGPVTNREFTERLAHAVHRPALVAVPAFALRLLFGEMADETVLVSQRVLPKRLQALGFAFRHPTLDEALAAALRG